MTVGSTGGFYLSSLSDFTICHFSSLGLFKDRPPLPLIEAVLYFISRRSSVKGDIFIFVLGGKKSETKNAA